MADGPEQSNSSSASAKRFDHLLVELLANNDGIFIGEEHTAPSLVQSITKLLPMLKAHGVATLSIELDQKRISGMKDGAVLR